MSNIITKGGSKKGVECGQQKRWSLEKIWTLGDSKIENRTQTLCQKFVGFSLLEPLKISKMRTDENIIKKPKKYFYALKINFYFQAYQSFFLNLELKNKYRLLVP